MPVASIREKETAASGIECRIVCCVLVCAASAAASSTARAPVAFKFQLNFSFILFAPSFLVFLLLFFVFGFASFIIIRGLLFAAAFYYRIL